MLFKIIQILLFQGVFILLYDLWLQKETFYTANRFYLLLTSLLSILLPFIPIQISSNTAIGSQMEVLSEVVLTTNTIQQLPEVIINTETVRNSYSVLSVIYFIGISLALLLFVWKLYKLIRLIYTNEKYQRPNFTIVSLKDEQKVFSFLKYVFIGEEDLKKQADYLLLHEQIHIQHKHTWDLLWFEFLKIVLWFNPFVYFYQKRITALHEFIADAESLKISDKKTYYNHLLNDIFQVEDMAFVNQFYTKSLIKKRITMMTKKQSQKWKKAKYLLVLPLIAFMLFMTADVTAQKMEEQQKKAFKKLMDFTKEHEVDGILSEKDYIEYQRLLKNAVPDSLRAKFKSQPSSYKEYLTRKNSPKSVEYRKIMKDAVPFAEIDEYPVFPGCEDVKEQEARKQCFNKSVQEHVAKEFNVDLAQKLGLTPGKKRIFVMFLIDKEGNITGVRARAPHKDLEKEASRVVLTLPKMKPGKENGKVVGVKYSLPITFLVQGEITKETNEIFNLDGTHEITEVEHDAVPMLKLDKAPVYPGCEKETDEKAKRKCLATKIQQFVAENFNTELSNDLGMSPGKKRIFVMFTINTKGRIDKIKVRALHKTLEEEAIRVVKKLPKIKPGKVKGKKVNVKYTMPISFIIEDDKMKK